MSWFYAILARTGRTINPPRPGVIHPASLFSVSNNTRYFASGGIAETCLYSGTAEAGWIVVGLGLKVDESGTSILGQMDWDRRMNNQDPDMLDGHFASLRWDRFHCAGRVDVLGQRAIYYAEFPDGLCISTRLDWVCRTTGRHDIDFAAFGSKWLLFNQVESNSSVSGVGRVGPNGSFTYDGERVVQSEGPVWVPSFGTRDTDRAEAIIKSIAHCALNGGKKVTLGLSGGIDSRTLLSTLLDLDGGSFAVHTFGDRSHPDVVIPGQIAAHYGLEHRYFDDPLPEAHELENLLRSYAAQVEVCEQCSSATKLRYYGSLHKEGLMMIDGGFGEISRRQYLNRVVHLGRGAFRTRDVHRLVPLMSVSRGDIFVREVSEAMRRGTEESLARALSRLPDADEVGLENVVDLFAVRTRVPFYGSPEQARLDTHIMNFMPFVQPSFLSQVLGVESALRDNGRFHRMLMRSCAPDLVRIPFEKSGVTYPFGLSSRAIWMIVRIKKKLGMEFHDRSQDQLLHRIRDFVIDTANSSAVTGYGAYDAKKIQESVTGYYRSPDARTASTVLWWLSFELWRRALVS